MAPPSEVQCCLHVTSSDALASILELGLQPRLGPMSAQLESKAGVYLFPSWADMQDAQWLFEDWAHEGGPALLAVDTRGLELQSEAPFELVSYIAIEPSRITILAPSEDNWHQFARQYGQMGGILPTTVNTFDGGQNITEKSMSRKP